MRQAGWAATALLAVACSGRLRSAALDTEPGDDATPADDKTGEVLEFDFANGIPETPGAGLFLPTPASRTYAGLIRDIERASTNASARGFFLRLGGETMGWAHAEELGLAFQRLREKTGKPVVCHAHVLDNRAAWFTARACSRIWLSPAGDLDTVGIAGQVVYLKGALDKLKIHTDILHMGRFKSAGESLTQEGPSDEARESLTAVLSSIRSTWLETYGAARKAKEEGDLEDGPWGPDEAKERGLIDAVGYESDARKDAEDRSKTSHVTVAFGNKSSDDSGFPAAEFLRLLAGTGSSTRHAHIVVLPAQGSIAMSGGGILSSDSGITAKGMEHEFRRLADDDTVKAVVLRIDSPGGSALASDLMWHDIMELRKKKPVVASVGDMAASGGYYLACAATKIVAERTSIVGSIGVLGGKIVVDDALSDLGVHAETFPASTGAGAASRAAFLSPLSPWDDATREKVRRQMQSVYELFLRRVAEGRGMPIDAVRAVAEGRIWSGVQGRDLHLVDELGGLGRALDVARGLARLPGDAPVTVEGAGATMLETLFAEDGPESSREVARTSASGASPWLARLAAPLRPFVASLAPLVEGETTILALPFALDVK